ncbi:pirin family protein [Calditrichota bacterium]
MIYPPEKQGSGQFDGGKITEIKPIGFPDHKTKHNRLGPLFYWAWASADGDGVIAMHPHKAFEIMSYVLEGEIGHTDNLGTNSRVMTGGAQMMQTGTGVYHQEEMYGDHTEFFQIWFEPDLRQSIKQPPTYVELKDQDFPVSNGGSKQVKTIIGDKSPVSIVANVKAYDVSIDPGGTYTRSLSADSSLAVVTIEGQGNWLPSGSVVNKRDYTVIKTDENTQVSIQAAENNSLRLFIIEVPNEVDYPLYS